MRTIITMLMLVLFITSKAQTNYYVSPNGDDTATGSITNPWATPVKAGMTAEAGDTVFFMEGIYHTGLYCLNSGSAEEGYITYTNYNDGLVIFDGEGVPNYNDEYNIWFEGLICNGDNSLPVHSSYLRIQGIHVRGYETWFGVLMMGPASHIEITNCKVYNNTTWGGHAVVIFAQLGNQDGMVSGRMTDIILDSNEVYNNNTGGNELMTIYGEVDGFKMTNNIIHDGTNICMDIIGRELMEGQPFGRPINGLINGNICYNAGEGSWGSGIYTDGAGRPELPNSIVIENNICFSNDFCGIEIGDEHEGEYSGGILVQNNIVYDNDFYGIWVGGGNVPPGEVRNVNVINNTSYNNGVSELAFGPSNTIVVKNNIFFASPTSNYILYTEGSGLDIDNTIDNNCWFPDKVFSWMGEDYSSYSAFKLATGQSQNGLLLDPQLEDPENQDFHLQTSSACIDSGTPTGAPDTDFEGVVRPQGQGFDIGAFEFSSSIATDEHNKANITFQRHPNPAFEALTITNENKEFDIDIINKTGQQVLVEKNIVTSRSIDIRMLSAGIYFVRWKNKDGIVVSIAKFIKIDTQ